MTARGGVFDSILTTHHLREGLVRALLHLVDGHVGGDGGVAVPARIVGEQGEDPVEGGVGEMVGGDGGLGSRTARAAWFLMSLQRFMGNFATTFSTFYYLCRCLSVGL